MPRTVVYLNGRPIIAHDRKPGQYIISSGHSVAAGEELWLVSTPAGDKPDPQKHPSKS